MKDTTEPLTSLEADVKRALAQIQAGQLHESIEDRLDRLRLSTFLALKPQRRPARIDPAKRAKNKAKRTRERHNRRKARRQ